MVAVGRAKGVGLPADHADKALAFADETLPRGMKASMAHDLERGNRLELDWLTGKVVELGRALRRADAGERDDLRRAEAAPYGMRTRP